MLILGVLVAAIAVVSIVGGGVISPAVGAAAVFAYLAGLFALYARVNLPQLGKNLQRSQSALTATVKSTAAARRAAARAKAHPDHGFGANLTLVDIGILVNEKTAQGRWVRHIAAGASLDDGFIQPFIKLYVPPEEAERYATLEFEFYDRSGRLQFSHKMEDYLRAGDNLFLCERQLPLRDNDQIGRVGMWDLRVKVDKSLVGLHGFSMNSASQEHPAVVAAPSRSRLSTPVDEHEAPPVSLEDLLREQARRSRNQG
jgi:hypothetical protein